MGALLTGSICLSDLDKSKITESKSNGKKYLNLEIWINDEKDRFGNDGSIAVRQSKEEQERKEKKNYLGNVEWKFKSRNEGGAQNNTSATTGGNTQQAPKDTRADDLPF